MSGTIIVSVEDLSAGGLSSQFEIDISILEAAPVDEE